MGEEDEFFNRLSKDLDCRFTVGNVEATMRALPSPNRMAPSKAYADSSIAPKVINDDDVLAWETILNKIDIYTIISIVH